jgi:hypothetical protein
MLKRKDIDREYTIKLIESLEFDYEKWVSGSFRDTYRLGV